MQSECSFFSVSCLRVNIDSSLFECARKICPISQINNSICSSNCVVMLVCILELHDVFDIVILVSIV